MTSAVAEARVLEADAVRFLPAAFIGLHTAPVLCIFLLQLQLLPASRADHFLSGVFTNAETGF